MRFDFVTLKLFVSVVEERSISKASEREYIAASASSKRITELEDRLGVTLLYRQQRGVVPTPAGESLFYHARNVLRTLERASGEMSEYATGVRGHIRLCANTSVMVQFFPGELGAFLAEHPLVKVDLEERLSPEIVRAVSDQMADIGIIVEGVPTGSLQLFPYHRDRVTLVTPSDHPLAQRASVSFAETLDYDHVGVKEGASLHALVLQAAREIGRGINLRIQVTSFEALLKLVQAKLGITFLPESCVLPFVESMGLQAIPLEESWADRQFLICVRDFEALPITARRLVDHLRQDAADAVDRAPAEG